MDCLKKFVAYFISSKKELARYSFLSLIVALLELLGVALTYPFVLQLLSAEKSDCWYKSPIFLGLLIVALFLAKNIFMIFYTYLQAKFTKNIEAEINLKFMKFFLSAPYQKTSEISFAKKNNILGCIIPSVTNNYVLRLLNLNVNFFIFGLISILLVIKFPLATAVTVIFALVLISIQNSYFKPRLAKISKNISDSSILYNQRTNEALLNIKSVKASNNEKYFFSNYKEAILKFYKLNRDASFFNTIPPYITEPFIIILLFILLAIISCQTIEEPQKLLASFAVIVSAIFRLAPTISRIQVNLNGISSALPMVKELINLYEDLDIKNTNPLADKKFIEFTSNITLKDVTFCYRAGVPVLKDINLTINKGEFIGIAGLSGAGKTTLADVISNLLKIRQGEILIDGRPYSSPLNIGYIPQEFNILNSSIRENIAFGHSEINDERVIESLKKAQLYDFIVQNYKDGIYANPFVDSTGFSQGQKQRIAIARALYTNPDILILDEATSSLDLKTEDEICNVLKALKGEKTIIAIAHRLSTIKSADRIIYMENGTISDIAPFNELIKRSVSFKELVNLASVK